jgi:hypothetical protein
MKVVMKHVSGIAPQPGETKVPSELILNLS